MAARPRHLLTTLAERLQPAHTALIVVDMQNDFLAVGGATDRLGQEIEAGRAIIPPLQHLIEIARQKGVLVTYPQMTMDPDLLMAGDIHYLQWRFRWGEESALIKGTWGHQIVEELAPRPGDLPVEKNTFSAFVGTNLDLILRNNAIRTVVVTGVVTQGCVMATAKDALHLGYYVVVASDCVASRQQHMHDAAILLMSNMQLEDTVVPSSRILSEWAAASGMDPVAAPPQEVAATIPAR